MICDFGASGLVEASVENRSKAREKRVAAVAGHHKHSHPPSSRPSRVLASMAATPLGFHALPLPLAQLSLQAVLKCGQSFRWSIYPLHASLPSEPSHEYRLCLQDRVVCLRQSPDTLFYRTVFPDSQVSHEAETTRGAETLLWLRDYFQLDVDLVKLYGEWSEKDPVFSKLRGRFEGIRMLRQDPWENLIS